MVENILIALEIMWKFNELFADFSQQPYHQHDE